MSAFIVAGNWKMNKTPSESQEFLKQLKTLFKAREGRELCLFPSYLSLPIFQQELSQSPISFGAQNCYFEDSGAFTGEVSPQMLKSVGATHCLVGHSERRTLFMESHSATAKKVKLLQASGLIPVLCVGETEQQRLEGQTLDVIRSQLEDGLKDHVVGQKVILAYEPVWAIGTGKVATPQNVEDVHAFIYNWVQDRFSITMPILYGGSVSPKNCKELEQVPHVNGFLIGGASLQVESLLAIYG